MFAYTLITPLVNTSVHKTYTISFLALLDVAPTHTCSYGNLEGFCACGLASLYMYMYMNNVATCIMYMYMLASLT